MYGNDTLTSDERGEAASILQRGLASGSATPVWLGLERDEAVRLINTLRGHDLLDLGEAVVVSLQQTGGELSLAVSDLLSRMDDEEHDEFLAHLKAKLNHEEPVDFQAVFEPVSAELDQETQEIFGEWPGLEEAFGKLTEVLSLGGGSLGRIHYHPSVLEALAGPQGRAEVQGDDPSDQAPERPVSVAKVRMVWRKTPNGLIPATEAEVAELERCGVL